TRPPLESRGAPESGGAAACWTGPSRAEPSRAEPPSSPDRADDARLSAGPNPRQHRTLKPDPISPCPPSGENHAAHLEVHLVPGPGPCSVLLSDWIRAVTRFCDRVSSFAEPVQSCKVSDLDPGLVLVPS
uniref:Uncharacterized protein n=1 Tax=Scophthalmus maximus TaxID=52904 RepID=A0A8D3C4G8_SCOMX